MLKQGIEKLIGQQSLSEPELEASVLEMIETENISQVAAFLSLLSAKGETVSEILTLVKVIQRLMIKIPTTKKTLDIVGTGGDGFNTFNISSGAALLAASTGVTVAKHGNRGVSSKVGSADVLEYLGVAMHAEAELIAKSLSKHQFAFCYAPNFHQTLYNLKTVRQELKVSTVFNLLGPLLNPTTPQHLMIGVANPKHLQLLADVLLQLNCNHSMVFHCQGLDELCTLGPVAAIEINHSQQTKLILDPMDYSFNYCQLADLQGGNLRSNAQGLLAALSGIVNPLADTLIFNAGVANYLFGLSPSIETGVKLARTHQRQGLAINLLNKLGEK